MKPTPGSPLLSRKSCVGCTPLHFAATDPLISASNPRPWPQRATLCSLCEPCYFFYLLTFLLPQTLFSALDHSPYSVFRFRVSVITPRKTSCLYHIPFVQVGCLHFYRVLCYINYSRHQCILRDSLEKSELWVVRNHAWLT